MLHIGIAALEAHEYLDEPAVLKAKVRLDRTPSGTFSSTPCGPARVWLANFFGFCCAGFVPDLNFCYLRQLLADLIVRSQNCIAYTGAGTFACTVWACKCSECGHTLRCVFAFSLSVGVLRHQHSFWHQRLCNEGPVAWLNVQHGMQYRWLWTPSICCP